MAIRNVFRHRLRSGLTLGAIVFGVCSIILSGGFIEDIFVQLREATIHSQFGHLQVYKTGFYAHGRREPYAYLIQNPDEIIWPPDSRTQISDVLSRVSFTGLMSNGRAELPIIGQGIEPEKEAKLGTFLTYIAGRPLTASDAFGLVAGQGLANALRLEVGDYATVLTNTPDGSLNSLEFEVVGIFQSFSREYDDRAVRIPLAAAQELLLTDGIHSIVIVLKNTELTDAVATQLRVGLNKNDFEVKTWYQLAGFYRKTVDLYSRQFGVLQLIILVMVMLSVSSSVNMSVYERTGEFGTLMAIGTRRKVIFTSIMLEHTILGLFGAVLGAVTGIGLAWLISSVGIPMPPPPNSNIGYTAYVRVVPWIVLTAALIGLIATVLAALFPALRARRVPIAEALRQNV